MEREVGISFFFLLVACQEVSEVDFFIFLTEADPSGKKSSIRA
jgi:hypothetical protein